MKHLYSKENFLLKVTVVKSYILLSDSIFITVELTVAMFHCSQFYGSEDNKNIYVNVITNVCSNLGLTILIINNAILSFCSSNYTEISAACMPSFIEISFAINFETSNKQEKKASITCLNDIPVDTR